MSVPTRSHPFPERFGTPRSQRSQPFPLYRGGGTLGTVRGNGKGGRDPGRSQYSASRAAGAHAPFVDLVPMPGEKEGGLARGSSFTFSAEAVRHG